MKNRQPCIKPWRLFSDNLLSVTTESNHISSGKQLKQWVRRQQHGLHFISKGRHYETIWSGNFLSLLKRLSLQFLQEVRGNWELKKRKRRKKICESSYTALWCWQVTSMYLNFLSVTWKKLSLQRILF